MGSESNSSSASASPSAKRSRDPEDELYIDNLHSHKRYLSEIMASSLNGLTVGEDPIHENLIDSPARSDIMYYLREDMGLQYSPMLEDIDDSHCCENHVNNCSPQPESRPTSPVSPYRYQRPVPPTPYPSHCCNLTSVTCSQTRPRGSDSEGRFPSSPSDICHSADLRRAALMRSVQIRTQEEPVMNIEEQCMKSLVDEREDYRIDQCSSLGSDERAFAREKSRVESLVDETEDQIVSTFDNDTFDQVSNMKGKLGLDDSENS